MTKTKIIGTLVLSAFFAVGASAVMNAHAQVMATMPVLYNASGQAVNTVPNVPLAAGWYFLQPGGSSTYEVYYAGNGTYSYYDTNMGSYGGSVNDPDGTAGVTLNYVATLLSSPGTPGIPNTGAGGDSTMVWVTLILSGLVAGAGLAFLVSSRKNLVPKEQ